MTFSVCEIGRIEHESRVFGQSVKGVPLEIIEPTTSKPEILIMGSIHGDESLTTVILSLVLRSLKPQDLRSAVIMSTNPDGILKGTRCNARGVDLNRNFPTENWSAEKVYYRNSPESPQNIDLSPGAESGSEPETQAVIKIVQELHPKLIVSLHGFLDCIDDPLSTEIARDISSRTGMKLVSDIGYATPGSFGSWCAEQQISIITYELGAAGMHALREIHIPVLSDLMTGYYISG